MESDLCRRVSFGLGKGYGGYLEKQISKELESFEIEPKGGTRMDMYEVIVVGAGPAGCMLAQTAGKRCRVLLVESRDLHVHIEDEKEKS